MDLRRFLARTALALALAALTAPALAQSICAPLEARLAGLQRSDGGEARQQEEELRRAEADYERAYRDARAADCIGGGLFADPAPSCGRIMAALDRSEAALRRAEARRDRFAYDPRRIADERREILLALADNRCGPQYERFAERPPPRRRGLLSELFGGPDDFGWNDYEDEFFDIPVVSTYRTLCVRTCDGYFFPISFATIRSQFSRDELTCQSMCPASEVALYYHLNPGEDAASAVSVNGAPYSLLPNAFAYQSRYNPDCTCHNAATIGVAFNPIGEEVGRAATRAPVPVPVARPDFEEDPETAANRRGRYAPGVVPPREDAVANLIGEDGVRLVGPAYYYAH